MTENIISVLVLTEKLRKKLRKKLTKNYSIEKKFADGKNDECLDEIDTYFNERIEKEIRGQYIFQVCRNCLLNYFYTIKGDLGKLFHLKVCEC